MSGEGYFRGRTGGRRSVVAFLLVFAVVSVSLPIAVGAVRPCLSGPVAFDQGAWGSRAGLCDPRSAMADDLIDNRLSPGMSRQDVIALLGAPDPDERAFGGDWSVVYGLGCGIDCDWLVIDFDSSWRLTSAWQVQD